VDNLVTVIIVMGVALLAVTAYMQWAGVMNLFTSRSAGRYGECGHLCFKRSDPYAQCWRCRPATISHSSRLIHH
jgi:hypothetical protein